VIAEAQPGHLASEQAAQPFLALDHGRPAVLSPSR
jgi:hypothetical protein